MAELSEIIEREMLKPFEWGVSDCCLAVCNVLVAMGRDDPAARYRGRYSDEAGGRGVMAGTTMRVAVREARRLRWSEIDQDEALDGDVGIVRRSLAIFSDGWWWSKSEAGCILDRQARRAWRPR